jgi:hypothetical protein
MNGKENPKGEDRRRQGHNVAFVTNLDHVTALKQAAGEFGVWVEVVVEPGQEYEVMQSGYKGRLADNQAVVGIGGGDGKQSLTPLYERADAIQAKSRG